MREKPREKDLVSAINQYAYPLDGDLRQYEPILEAAKDARFVLIGEATHGTTEFYRSRMEITTQLIKEQGFDAIAVEADWPDAYIINRYVSGQEELPSAEASLRGFERFPTWMWRNKEVLRFVEWLRAYNQLPEIRNIPEMRNIGFYGIDLYSMNTSIHAVIGYLQRIDPLAARRAKDRYSCLEHFMNNPQSYGYAAEFGIMQSCEEKIIEQLLDLRRNASAYMKKDGFVAEDEYFCASQNAKLVKDAEGYYRSLFRNSQNSWNLRDQHMFETLVDLEEFISVRRNKPAKIVVWAHNVHIGDASATEMKARGEFNIGQLMREKYGNQALLVGFSTSSGMVTAASEWDSSPEQKIIQTPLQDSYEEIFHQIKYERFLMDLRQDNMAVNLLMEERPHRAIGVIYRPKSERESHYYQSILPKQFDFMIHFDTTTAIEPIYTTARKNRGEMEETYPSGM